MNQVSGGRVRSVRHESTRLIVEVDADFDDFQRRFEAVMPAARAADYFDGASTWDEVCAKVAAAAPLGMILYVKGPVGDAFALAGHNVRCAYYVIGNFSEAAEMFGRDPSVFQYMPFHVFLTETPSGGTALYFDQPSSVVAVFDDPEITRCAREFDEHFAAVLKHLGAPVPEELAV
jgi:hypothetical protein